MFNVVCLREMIMDDNGALFCGCSSQVLSLMFSLLDAAYFNAILVTKEHLAILLSVLTWNLLLRFGLIFPPAQTVKRGPGKAENNPLCQKVYRQNENICELAEVTWESSGFVEKRMKKRER